MRHSIDWRKSKLERGEQRDEEKERGRMIWNSIKYLRNNKADYIQIHINQHTYKMSIYIKQKYSLNLQRYEENGFARKIFTKTKTKWVRWKHTTRSKYAQTMTNSMGYLMIQWHIAQGLCCGAVYLTRSPMCFGAQAKAEKEQLCEQGKQQKQIENIWVKVMNTKPLTADERKNEKRSRQDLAWSLQFSVSSLRNSSNLAQSFYLSILR